MLGVARYDTDLETHRTSQAGACVEVASLDSHRRVVRCSRFAMLAHNFAMIITPLALYMDKYP